MKVHFDGEKEYTHDKWMRGCENMGMPIRERCINRGVIFDGYTRPRFRAKISRHFFKTDTPTQNLVLADRQNFIAPFFYDEYTTSPFRTHKNFAPLWIVIKKKSQPTTKPHKSSFPISRNNFYTYCVNFDMCEFSAQLIIMALHYGVDWLRFTDRVNKMRAAQKYQSTLTHTFTKYKKICLIKRRTEIVINKINIFKCPRKIATFVRDKGCSR